MQKVMSLTRSIYFVGFLALLLLGLSSQWSTASANTPQAIGAKTTTFYKWYVGQIKANKDPMQNREMIRKHVSNRLWNWLNTRYKNYGADYFIDAQDFGDDWDSARVGNFRWTGSGAAIQIILGRGQAGSQGLGQRSLNLKMVKQSGAWKIDRVNNN